MRVLIALCKTIAGTAIGMLIGFFIVGLVFLTAEYANTGFVIGFISGILLTISFIGHYKSNK